MATKRTWNELSPTTRAAVVAAGIVQIALIGIAHADLSRRTDDQVRGSRRMWRLLTLVNFVGPISYFAVGRLPKQD